MSNDSPPILEWIRMLSATLFVALLYLLLQSLEFKLMTEAGRRGWLTNNIEASLAEEARQVAEHSVSIEASFDPQHRKFAWILGMRLGYASELLGSFALSDTAVKAKMRQGLADMLTQAAHIAETLGIGPVDTLPVLNAKQFADLRQRIEADELGIGARIETHTTLRAKHLFLLGMQVGVALATLDSSLEAIEPPAGKEIVYHAVLAGVPESLWRPLSLVSGDSKAEAKRAYQQAITSLDAWLAIPN